MKGVRCGLQYHLMMRETRAQQPAAETTEEPSPKKRRRTSIWPCSSDSDTDDEEESIEHCLIATKQSQQWTQRGVHYNGGQREREHLSTPAPVPCEGWFSLSGHTVHKKRASVSPHNVNKLVCLSNWLSVKKD
ncbi:hypothetical protein KUCAC02_019510 [Chaenocephalus aceratus]|uniref:Uncharacterized protein n=1 Tax=Chaenocephalus aceratus TaxID=36190 RepID=A0ACB9VPC5_CHAAC|nr:hypothetical protein KUCAC02_019510 [Chaenocephalus aceratus]